MDVRDFEMFMLKASKITQNLHPTLDLALSCSFAG